MLNFKLYKKKIEILIYDKINSIINCYLIVD